MSKRRFVVRGGKPLRGSVRIPGDKSIGHRSLIFAALAEGSSHITGMSGGLDNLSTAQVFRDMGVGITLSADGQEALVDGVGLHGLTIPKGDLDCGNSGTSMRLIAGILAAQRFGARLTGDESLVGRPMRRIVSPLKARGAHIGGRAGKKEGEVYPPLSVAPLVEDEALGALEYSSPVASAQVKSCLLLSGLYANGMTAISEPVVSRDHTERMMSALGIPIQAMSSMVVLDPADWDRRWDGFTWEVPGDISSAAFVLAAALLVPKSDVTLTGVGLNPTRTGIIDVLRSMRANLEIAPHGEGAGNEPIGDLRARATILAPAMTAGELLTRMIDEVPVFCALAAGANGKSEVRDAEELRVKESDRISASTTMLKAFGVDCTELQDGLLVHGGNALHGAEVDSEGDHRIAMSAAILGLMADGETIVHDVSCVDTSFPGFVELLAGLGADIETKEAT